jgi:hypothetical protein
MDSSGIPLIKKIKEKLNTRFMNVCDTYYKNDLFDRLKNEYFMLHHLSLIVDKNQQEVVKKNI